MGPASVTFESLQRTLHEQVYALVMRLRYVIAPLPVLLGGFVIVVDDTLWRRLAIGSALSSAALLLIRTRWVGVPRLEQTLLFVGMGLHPILLVATGGVYSPVLMAMLLVTFIASSMLERRLSLLLLSFQLLSILGVAALEYSGLVECLIPVPFATHLAVGVHSVWPLIYATLACLFFAVAWEMGSRVQRAFAGMLQSEVAAREEALRLHQEQLSELTSLGGEIAHELKNPLSSIKGLAALLARRAQGQEPEALTVLRREVDRMQVILEEFLNFSRPLVPLSLAPANLVGLVSEVCVLHEGVAELRQVCVKLEGPACVTVVCDARKIRQILVNLLQNALEASAPGSTIRIRVKASRHEVRVNVDDCGPGLSPQLADRAFQSGVTSKAGGSGLGLNVARGLARQHGGDVTLSDRPEGGCSAVLRLPLEPATRCSGAGPGPARALESLAKEAVQR